MRCTRPDAYEFTNILTSSKRKARRHLCFLASVSCSRPTSLRLALSVYFVGNCELFATVAATVCKHAATVRGLHAMAETMLVVALAVVGLECSLHDCILFLFVLP